MILYKENNIPVVCLHTTAHNLWRHNSSGVYLLSSAIVDLISTMVLCRRVWCCTGRTSCGVVSESITVWQLRRIMRPCVSVDLQPSQHFTMLQEMTYGWWRYLTASGINSSSCGGSRHQYSNTLPFWPDIAIVSALAIRLQPLCAKHRRRWVCDDDTRRGHSSDSAHSRPRFATWRLVSTLAQVFCRSFVQSWSKLPHGSQYWSLLYPYKP